MLYEKCPTCGGTRLITREISTRKGIAVVSSSCPACKDGFVEHACPRDDSCPCYADGRERELETPRTPLGA